MKLDVTDLHDCFSSDSMDKVALLNEVAKQYPKAVSLASGSPSKDTYGVGNFAAYFEAYVDYSLANGKPSREAVYIELGNYGGAKGLIQQHIARLLLNDEGIVAPTASIVVTGGAQEAIALSLHTLFKDQKDVLLVIAPFYSGIEGASLIYNLEVEYVRECASGIDIADLRKAVEKIIRSGRKPRALYCTPNYSNPSGLCMSFENRVQLLRVCLQHGILILEDNTYGAIGWSSRPPSLKSMDRTNQVIHIGTFSKTICPGMRVGYLVADQSVGDDKVFLADYVARIKSMTTNNTSHFSQAIVAGYLITNGHSMGPLLERKLVFYKANRDYLLQLLHDRFADIPAVSWTFPTGGLFIVVQLPFEVDIHELHYAAQHYDVIWLPIGLFHSSCDRSHSIRLAYGNVSREELKLGVGRLCEYILTRLASEKISFSLIHKELAYSEMEA